MNTPTLGIDIAYLSFQAALWFDHNRCLKAEFANHKGGFRKLERWFKQHNIGLVRVGLESTNTYAEALAQWLHKEGHQVYLLNPERVSCYGRSLGQRNKTDSADSLTIARFVASHDDLTPWTPPPAEQRALRALLRVRHQLVETRKQLANQLRTAEAVVQPHLKAVLKSIDQQLSAIAKEIKAHLHTHPFLNEKVKLLTSTKGVGLITAATVIAELPPITSQTDPRAICAWAGLTPHRRQSGQTEGPARLSRKGNAYLRNALYMPALVAKRYNPLLRAFAQRLASHGKSQRAILGAVAHKMLRILVGLLRSNSTFDPNWSPQKK